MRTLVVVAVVLALLWLLGSSSPGALGGLMIAAVPVLFLRGFWLFVGDLRRIGGPRR